MSSIVVYSPIYADAAGQPANSTLIDALSRALYARDLQTQEHAERVRQYALELSAEVGVRDDATSGYPDRLAGLDIPVGARVIAIVDCYDALISDRPYRRALSHNSALAMIHQRRAVMYDPQMTDGFMRVLWRMRTMTTSGRFSEDRSAGRFQTSDRGGR